MNIVVQISNKPGYSEDTTLMWRRTLEAIIADIRTRWVKRGQIPR